MDCLGYMYRVTCDPESAPKYPKTGLQLPTPRTRSHYQAHHLEAGILCLSLAWAREASAIERGERTSAHRRRFGGRPEASPAAEPHPPLLRARGRIRRAPAGGRAQQTAHSSARARQPDTHVRVRSVALWVRWRSLSLHWVLAAPGAHRTTAPTPGPSLSRESAGATSLL